jgi:predicted nucleic acid-binding protein
MNDIPPVVLDSSIAIALVRNEPPATAIRAATRRWADQSRPMIAPWIFWFEVVNVLARRYRYGGLDILHAVHEIDEVGLVTIEPDRGLLLLTIDHVERFGLSSYDASYLALAESHGGDVATLDRALAAAAGARAISFDERHRLAELPAVYEHEVTWPNYKGASAYLAKLRVDAARSS